MSAYNLKDEVGNIYTYLTVLERATNTKEGRAKWLCQCKCGNTCVVLGKHLRSGNTKSCGCLQKEQPPARKNLLNQRFGKLIVAGNPRIGTRGTIWSCQCDCGTIVDVCSTELLGDKTHSCGCLKAELHSTMNDLTNQRFGKLIALDSNEVAKDGQRIWRCKCDCGSIINVLAGNLRKNNTSSCGCINSKGNMRIKQLLLDKDIIFKSEFIFSDCLTENGYPHRFDFALFNSENQLVGLIEYQGNIHFQYRENGWNTEETFLKRIESDRKKYDYCNNHNIRLYYINYTDNIIQKLEEILHDTNLWR